MKRITFCIIITLMSITSYSQLQVNASYFMNHAHEQSRDMGNFLVNSMGSYGYSFEAQLPVYRTRSSMISLGVGSSIVNFEDQYQGDFQHTGQVDLLTTNTQNRYLSFPITFADAFPSRRRHCRRIRHYFLRWQFAVTYRPSLLQKTHTTMGSSILGYSSDEFKESYDHLQHNLHLALMYSYYLSRKTVVSIAPYIGCYNNYQANESKKVIDGIQFGVSLKFTTRLNISINFHKESTSTGTTQQQIQKKQQEIEDKLNLKNPNK